VIEQALEGMLLGEHHPVLIRLHMDHITLLDRLAAGIDDEIEAALDAVPAAWGVAADGVPSPGPGTGCRGAARSGAARGDSWRQPQARPGDQRRDGPGHDPVPDRGSPGVLGRAGAGRPAVRPAAAQTLQGQGDVYLKTYCAQAANGTGNTDTFLGERLRRLTRRLGGTKAMCAVGRSILIIISPARGPRGQVLPTSAPAGTTSRQAVTARSAAISASSKH
jgi:hypothetical protein